MVPPLATDRLLLREWSPDDAAEAFAIYGDAEVMRFLGDGKPVPDLETQRKRLEDRLVHYRQPELRGFGVWAMVHRETGKIVGTLLLKPLPPTADDIEIGWHLAKHAWGQGYATEAAIAGLDYGFEILKLDKIYAVVKPANGRSIAVTRRIGMRPLGRTTKYYDAEELELFVVERTFKESPSDELSEV